MGAAIRLAIMLGAFILVIALLTRLLTSIRIPKLPRPQGRRPQAYDWERRTDRVYRRIKRVPAPDEDREAILGFVETRRGVEAYVEPKTMVSPLSVVLVAEDGEWRRFNLADDAYIRELTALKGLKVFDAVRTGYPKRMREFRPGSEDNEGDSGQGG
jgi:hypothetical protein